MNKALTLKLSHKGLLLVLVPLVFGLTCFTFLYAALSDAEQASFKEDQARVLSEQTNELSRAELDTTYELYKLYREYHATEFYRQQQTQKFQSALERLRRHFQTMQASLSSTPQEENVLANLQKRILTPFNLIEEQEHSGKRDRMQMALIMLSEMRVQPKIARDLGLLTKYYIEKEEAAFQSQVEHRRQLKQSLMIAIAFSIFLSLGLYTYFNRDTASRLALLLDNTIRFARKQQLHPPPQADDEIARLDTAFRQMAESITAAANNKQEFMAMLARDLRIPLDFINRCLQRLSTGQQSQIVSTKAADIVARSLDSSATLMRLVDDLLDVERAESGKLQMNFQSVPINSVVDKAAKALRGLAGDKSIKFTIPTTQSTVYADGDRLVQVLVNLLANAVKFSPDASTVRMELAERDAWLTVRVIDNGPGISFENQSLVFQRFHQISSSDRRSSGGTGLGLTICKQIVDAHHGAIGVESAEGTGCTFWFEVPRTQAAMELRSRSDTSPTNQNPVPLHNIRQADKTSPFSLRLTHKGLILLGVPLVFGLTCFGLLYGAVCHAETIAQKEAFAKTVNNHRTMLFQRSLEASSSFLDMLEGKTSHQSDFDNAVQGMHDELNVLRNLVARDPDAIRLLSQFQKSIMDPLDHLNQTAPQNLDSVSELIAKPFDFKSFEPILEPYRLMSESSYHIQSANTSMLKIGLLCAIAVNILLSLGLYVIFTRDTARRLDRVLDNTLRFARGERLNTLLTGRDEIAQLDKVFQAMTEAITRAANEKSEFMAMIAHDIRSPLSSTLTSLMLLADERMSAYVPKEARSIVESCIESSERVLQLINDLLDIEKLDAGMLQIQFEEVPIAYVLETAKRAVADLADKKQLKLNIPNSDADLQGDPKRLVQVMVNLLSSAVETAREGTSVTVELEDDESWLTLRVKDTTDNTSSTHTNLGWSMCKHIVAAHHGAIGAEETAGERMLWFRLPKAGNTIHLSEAAVQSISGATTNL